MSEAELTASDRPPEAWHEVPLRWSVRPRETPPPLAAGKPCAFSGAAGTGPPKEHTTEQTFEGEGRLESGEHGSDRPNGGIPQPSTPSPAAAIRADPPRWNGKGWIGTASSLAVHAAILAALIVYNPWHGATPLEDPDEVSVELVDTPPEQAAPPPESAASRDSPPTVVPSDATQTGPEMPATAPPAEAANPQPAPVASVPAEPPSQPAVITEPQPPAPAAIVPAEPAPRPAVVAEPPPPARVLQAKREQAEAAARERAQRRSEQAKRDQEAKATAAQIEAKERAARGAAEARRQAEAKAAAAAAANDKTQAVLAAASAYRGLVIGHLAGFKRYPPAARARGAQGNPVVAFTVDASGRVVSVSLARGSGDTDIDAEVLAMVRRASPFPPPPPGAPHAFSAGVNFRLQ